MNRAQDAVVIGAGIAGSTTALALQSMGLSVTLIDAWAPGHARATSAGDHRLIRSSHGGDELMTLWSREARLRWMELQEQAGIPLMIESGVCILAPDRHREWEDTSIDTLTRLGIPHFTVSPEELAIRLPVIETRNVAYGLWEPESGFVMARDGLLATIERFRQSGGLVQRSQVTTDSTERPWVDGKPIEADLIVAAAGPWMGGLFPRSLGPLLRVTRQDVLVVQPPPGDERYDHTSCPAWIDHGYPAYGIPAYEGLGFKAAIAWHETDIDLDNDDRIVDATALARLRRYLVTRFPGLAEEAVMEGKVCQIVQTPDSQFIIDFHPEHSDILFVAGGSGHLYKHGQVLGDFAAGVGVAKHTTNERFTYGPRHVAAGAGTPSVDTGARLRSR